MENLIKKAPPPYFESEIHKRATEDFLKLLSACNFFSRMNDYAHKLSSNTGEEIGEFLPFGANVQNKICEIPLEELNKYKNANLALVVYENERVLGVYILKISELLDGKLKRLIKKTKNNQLVVVKVKNYKKKFFEKYKFGVVLKEKIKV